MFGYVKPAPDDLLVREYEFYKATYCGVCRAMKRATGSLSRLSLSYDAVFLALVRMCYIEDGEIGTATCRCIAHPCRKRCMLNVSSALDYTARAFAILAYHKMRDDLADERFGKRLLRSLSRPVLSRARKKADLPALDAAVADKLAAIRTLENEGCASVDRPAELFGDLLGEVFTAGLPEADRLVPREVGRTLGRFIYAADAAEDYEADRRLGRYNPFVLLYEGQPLSDAARADIRTGLLLRVRELESAVHLLPYGRRKTLDMLIHNIVSEGLEKRLSFLTSAPEDSKHERSL